MQCAACEDSTATSMLRCGHVMCVECVRALTLAHSACCVCGAGFDDVLDVSVEDSLDEDEDDAVALRAALRTRLADMSARLDVLLAAKPEADARADAQLRRFDADISARIAALNVQRDEMIARCADMRKRRAKEYQDAVDAARVGVAQLDALQSMRLTRGAAAVLANGFVLPPPPALLFEIVMDPKVPVATHVLLDTGVCARNTRLDARKYGPGVTALWVLPRNDRDEALPDNCIANVTADEPCIMVKDFHPWMVLVPRNAQRDTFAVHVTTRCGTQFTLHTPLYNMSEVLRDTICLPPRPARAMLFTVSECGAYVAFVADRFVHVLQLHVPDGGGVDAVCVMRWHLKGAPLSLCLLSMNGGASVTAVTVCTVGDGDLHLLECSAVRGGVAAPELACYYHDATYVAARGGCLYSCFYSNATSCCHVRTLFRSVPDGEIELSIPISFLRYRGCASDGHAFTVFAREGSNVASMQLPDVVNVGHSNSDCHVYCKQDCYSLRVANQVDCSGRIVDMPVAAVAIASSISQLYAVCEDGRLRVFDVDHS